MLIIDVPALTEAKVAGFTNTLDELTVSIEQIDRLRSLRRSPEEFSYLSLTALQCVFGMARIAALVAVYRRAAANRPYAETIWKQVQFN